MRTVNPVEHARKRARILDAAAHEFAEHGVDGATTAGVCARAGIGAGTLFHYFRTKREMVYALFADDLPAGAEARRRALAEPDPGHGLRLLVGHLLSDLDHALAAGLAAAAIFQANRDEEFAAMIAAEDGRTRDALTTLLRRNAKAGRRPLFPPDRAARWIQTLVDASYITADDGFDADRQTGELRRLLDVLTDGGSRGDG
ncbi:MAG TPA: TetR/AcrR family transcriptional regulator [Actinocatenispora sp.]